MEWILKGQIEMLEWSEVPQRNNSPELRKDDEEEVGHGPAYKDVKGKEKRFCSPEW